MNKLPRSSFSHPQSTALSQSTVTSQTNKDTNQAWHDSLSQGCAVMRETSSTEPVAFADNMASTFSASLVGKGEIEILKLNKNFPYFPTVAE